ncbi:MAG: hypothetical protein IPF72_11835 [Chitinophagaceae bacterium]|nr:hypothetical protein [Chitinophagaceae bacterium]
MKKITLLSLILIATVCTQAKPCGILNKATETNTTQHAKNMDNKVTIKEPEGYYIDENGISGYGDDLKIIFSSVPFNGGDGQMANSFTSASRIYAKLTATKGTLKDVLKIADNDDGIKIYLVLYNEAGEKIKRFVSIAETFALSVAQANSKSITLDILPDPAIFNSGKQSDFWVGAAFAYGHNQYNFTQNGNYKVGLFVTNEKLDDWGKPIYGDDIVFANYFTYSFSAKDAINIVKESQTISDAKNNAVKNAITPLPKQWTEKSSNLVMGFTQAQLIKMYENSFADKMDAHTVVKFHASSSNGGWTVVNNDFGIPTYRYSNQWYTVFIKYANGKTCFYQGFGLRQQYNGGGTYGAAFIDKNDYYMTDCATMK